MSAAFNLRSYRESVGLNQATLAKLLGVARSTVMRWEAGLMGFEDGREDEIRRAVAKLPPCFKPKRIRRNGK